MALLNLIALYNYDNTLLDDLEIPSGLDRNACIDLLLTETAEFNMIYPDPTMFKQRLDTWNTRRMPIWLKLWDTTQYEYDPIANYDRTETHTETVTHTGTDSTQRNDQTTHTGTVSNQNSATDTTKKTGYNSDTLQTTEQTESSGNSTDTNNLTDNSQGSSTLTRNLQDSVTRSIRAYGNIGVTTTQQMIEAERESVRFDMYKVICDDFIDAFCVYTY